MSEEPTRSGSGLTAALAASFTAAPGLSATAALCALVAAVSPAVFAVLTAHLLAAIPAAVRHHGHGPSAEHVDALLVACAVVFAFQRVLPTLQAAVAAQLGRRLNAVLQRRVMLACQAPVHLDSLDDPEVQAAISLVRDSTSGIGLPGDAIAGFFGVVGPKLAGLGGVALLARYSLLYGAGGLVIYLLLNAGLLRALVLLAGSDVAARASFLPAEYARATALGVGSARELRLFGASGWITERMSGSYLRAMRLLWRQRDRYMLRLALVLLSTAGTLSVLFYAELTSQAATGRLSLTAFLVLLNASRLVLSVDLGEQDLQAMHGGASMQAIVELERRLGRERTRSSLSDPVRLADLAPAREIHLEKLTLRHAGASQDVLHGLDLRIPAGQRLAVVGRNGAGKTTLATVLAGLRKPTEGRLFVDGVDLATVDTSSWQRRVAVLSQDFVHYPLTAYDNVGLGCPELLSDRDAVLGAAELAGATGVIAAIPGGWDSVLDPTLAGGTDLSGGQWQRIGLARALLAVAGGARVLVLDEPTSALDVRAEAALFAELITMPALRGVTVILISHRFGSVRQAERIVVLDDGRVCEDGTHSELVDAGGLYASLFSSQAELFREPCDPGGPAAVGEVALDA